MQVRHPATDQKIRMPRKNSIQENKKNIPSKLKLRLIQTSGLLMFLGHILEVFTTSVFLISRKLLKKYLLKRGTFLIKAMLELIEKIQAQTFLFHLEKNVDKKSFLTQQNKLTSIYQSTVYPWNTC